MTSRTEGFLASSFRDPAGRVMRLHGVLYRSVTPSGLEDYKLFTSSGLAKELVDNQMLVPFHEAGQLGEDKLLQLEELPFVSYPYEWCFGQLLDAAKLTVRIALAALQKGMILKDASAFNVAWHWGKPIFIDHGSFTRYQDGQPWQAYQQFVTHFLGPLMLMCFQDLRYLEFFRNHLEGFPLDFISRNLPLSTWFRLGPLIHIHLHSRFQKNHSNRRSLQPVRAPRMPRNRLQAMLQDLLELLNDLKTPREITEWCNYYQDTNYSKRAFDHKKQLVEEFVAQQHPDKTIDFGANDGTFSFLAAKHSRLVIAADFDPIALQNLYVEARTDYPGVYPILQNLHNPSPALGILNAERESFLTRAKGDLALGLALLHHLRIGNNWTLQQCLELFTQTAPNALLEFVPKSDSQVQRLLRSRPDICSDWDLPAFLNICHRYYRECDCIPIVDSGRILVRLRQRL